MGRFLKHTTLFLLPVWGMILLLPVEARFKFQGLKDDCSNRAIWIYDRLNSDPVQPDVVFLGSSRTVNGINDRLVSSNTGHLALNLGYCRLGRNLHYVLLKKLLDHHPVKTVVVEVRKEENRYSHPVFPYLATTKDVMFPYPFFNRDILKDIWTHFIYRIELTQDRLYRQTAAAPLRNEAWGYMPAQDTANMDFLDEVLQRRMHSDHSYNDPWKAFYRQYARGYLRKINHLCLKHDVQLIFLYIPAYGVSHASPTEIDFYRSLGEVWTAPREILTNPDNWYDEDHFNDAGAEALSRWLSEQLIKD